MDYYNHNLDSTAEFYRSIISTRTYQDRLDTLANVRQAGIKVCSGGIVGMGESRAQRAGLIAQQGHDSTAPVTLDEPTCTTRRATTTPQILAAARQLGSLAAWQLGS